MGRQLWGSVGFLGAIVLTLGNIGCAGPERSVEAKGYTQAKLLAPRAVVRAPASQDAIEKFGIHSWEAYQGGGGAMHLVGISDIGLPIQGLSVVPEGFGGSRILTRINDGSGTNAIFDTRSGQLMNAGLGNFSTSPFGNVVLHDLDGLGGNLRLMPGITTAQNRCASGMFTGLGRGLLGGFGDLGMFGNVPGSFGVDCRSSSSLDMMGMFDPTIGGFNDPFLLEGNRGMNDFDFFGNGDFLTSARADEEVFFDDEFGCGSGCGSDSTFKDIETSPRNGATKFTTKKKAFADDFVPPLPERRPDPIITGGGDCKDDPANGIFCA